ncbi:unnamed protein product [Mucor hiemalis]
MFIESPEVVKTNPSLSGAALKFGVRSQLVIVEKVNTVKGQHTDAHGQFFLISLQIHLACWPKIVNQLRSFATETEVTPMRSITNIITNKDNATVNQTFNNNTIVSGSSSGSNLSSNSNNEREASSGKKTKNDEKLQRCPKPKI